MASRERMREFDMLRWIAIACVVFIHVSALTVRAGDRTVLAWANQAVRFAVPAFVFMAGGLAWTRPPGRGRYGAYLLSRARTVLLPYAVFSLAYSAVALRIAHASWSGYPRAALFELVTGRAWAHLYFVPVVLAVYLTAPLAARAVGRRPGVTFAVLLAVSLLVAPPLVGSDAAALSVIGTVLLYGPYAAAGAWYASRRSEWAPRLARRAGLVLAGAAVAGLPRLAVLEALDPTRRSSILGGLYVKPVDLLCIAALLAVCLAWADRSPRASRLAERGHPLVYGVYLAHPLLVYVALRVAARFDAVALLAGPLVALALTALVLAFVTLAVWVLAASRGTGWLVGVPGGRTGREAGAV